MTALEKFDTEGEAALHLLRDATKILSAATVDFVVVGGWVPFLFHSKRYGHPGTFDLDVLINRLAWRTALSMKLRTAYSARVICVR